MRERMFYAFIVGVIVGFLLFAIMHAKRRPSVEELRDRDWHREVLPEP